MIKYVKICKMDKLTEATEAVVEIIPGNKEVSNAVNKFLPTETAEKTEFESPQKKIKYQRRRILKKILRVVGGTAIGGIFGFGVATLTNLAYAKVANVLGLTAMGSLIGAYTGAKKKPKPKRVIA
jgi:hypothetical protein